MDAQIIICREDNTDFLSLGFIQTDTSLVSALGGALANFAQEIGLASDASATETPSMDTLNLSKFQNGILASKVVRVKNHQPIILIAIKGFTGQDKDLDFIATYATELAKAVVTKFESEYQSIGFIPKLDAALEQIIAVANQLYRKDSDKIKLLIKTVKSKIPLLLDDLWENQSAFEEWSQGNLDKRLAYLSQKELLTALAKYFYIQGTKDDAFFPLLFAYTANPFPEIVKLLDGFLQKKASIARKEINEEISKIILQLKNSSRALSRQERGDIPTVELINESAIFEKILLTKFEQMESKVREIMLEVNQDLYRKLFKKFPLKFVAMSKDAIFDKAELESLVNKNVANIFKAEFSDRTWVSEKITSLLRKFAAKYSPNDFLKKRNELILSTYSAFIELIKKEHPFLLFADPNLKSLEQFIKKETGRILDNFSTTVDEAVILYNAVGQIHSSYAQEMATFQDLMLLFFLQEVIHPYQFRDVPNVIYNLVADCLAKSSFGKKYRPEELLQNSLKQYELLLNFSIPTEIKKRVLKRTAKAKTTMTRFENYENLAYFFKSFRASLEVTISRLLQNIFGPEKFPLPPTAMSKAIQKVANDLQSIFIITSSLNHLTKRPYARELFSSKTISFLAREIKSFTLLPKPLTLAQKALATGWIKSATSIKGSSLTLTQLRRLEVKIPELNLEDTLEELLAKPLVLEFLWIKFSPSILIEHQMKIKTALEKMEQQMKVKAGNTDGKQKFGSQVKLLRNIYRWFSAVLSGGRFARKARLADIQQFFQETSKEIHKSLRYHPSNYSVLMSNGNLKSIVSALPIEGDFQDLIKLYSSLWIENSQVVERIIDGLFWSSFSKGNGPPFTYEPLGKKIIQALSAAQKKPPRQKDKSRIIRAIIEREIVPAFNRIVRTALSDAFSIFKEDGLVKFNAKTKQWYISLGTVEMPKTLLTSVFSSLNDVALVKRGDKQTEVQFLLTKYYPLVRQKEDQSIEEFIRKAAYYRLNKKELKALDFFNGLIETYIGSSAADLFYSYVRAIIQIIITPQ